MSVRSRRACRRRGRPRQPAAGGAAGAAGLHRALRVLHAAQRIEGGGEPRSNRPGGAGRGDLQHRLPRRAQGPYRLRPPVRAHDVPGLGPAEEARAHPVRLTFRRRVERIDALRLHQLLRGGAVQRPRPDVVARGRSHALARPDSREPEEPAERGQRGSAGQRPQPAAWRLRVARPVGEGQQQLAQRPQLLRRPVGARGGDARRRPGLLQDLLRAQQRRAGRGRRHHRRRGAGPGREALRQHPARHPAAAGRRQRAAADRREARRRATTSWPARRRWRSAGTCRRGCRRTSSRWRCSTR